MVELEEIREKYQILKEKYELPEFEKIDNDLELDNIDSRFILREIRRKIVDKLGRHEKSIEAVLQPDSGLSDMYECQHLPDERKAELFAIYKRLRYLDRYANLVSVQNSEQGNAEFVKFVYTTLLNLKPEIEAFYKEVKECWNIEEDTSTVLEYFG